MLSRDCKGAVVTFPLRQATSRAYGAAITRENDPQIRFVALGYAGAMMAIAVHSISDFNLYIPANAIVLVCIGGIAAGLPSSRAPQPAPARWFPLKSLALTCSLLLAAFTLASLIFEARFSRNPQAESKFCRFGICEIDSVLAAQISGKENVAAPQPLLLEAVRRDPVTPGRWSDLGQALFASGKVAQAKGCFMNVVALGPDVPPILLQATEFYQKTGEYAPALVHRPVNSL